MRVTEPSQTSPLSKPLGLAEIYDQAELAIPSVQLGSEREAVAVWVFDLQLSKSVRLILGFAIDCHPGVAEFVEQVVYTIHCNPHP
jgi:hypothetical protein